MDWMSQPMACTKLRSVAAVRELRQDDGLPCGTKVVPIATAISPLIIIQQEGPHRRSRTLQSSQSLLHPYRRPRKQILAGHQPVRQISMTCESMSPTVVTAAYFGGLALAECCLHVKKKICKLENFTQAWYGNWLKRLSGRGW